NGLTQVYSNGFTEGMNNKIKVLKRVAFGFRNFERFRARIHWASLKE
ncbi:transposase, partial [Megasphaera massiliensis]